MNKIEYIEVFTTLNVKDTVTWVRFRRESGLHKHETHKVDSIQRANVVNKILRDCFQINGATVGPWGIMSVVYIPKPAPKKAEVYPENSLEGERAYIRKLYEEASTLSNTSPIRALALYERCIQLEDAWYQKYYDDLSDDDSIMPESFYLDVVPLIKSRAAAATRSKLPASYYVCPVCGRQNDFTAWVHAHWDIRVEHNCFCGAKNYIKQGVLVD